MLELEIGASRLEVDNAYCRLLEQWHPDRVTPAGDAAAVREAARKVQVLNEAYQILIKTAPKHVAKLSAMAEARQASPAAETKPAPPRSARGPEPVDPGPASGAPALSPAAPLTKPKLTPLSPNQVAGGPPPPKPPPAETWAARPAPVVSAPTSVAAAPAITPPPAVAPSPAPGPKFPAAVPAAPPVPVPAAAAPAPAPAPQPVAAAPAPAPTPPAETPARKPKGSDTTPPTSPGFSAKALAFYDALFPVDSPRRRYGPFAVAGVVLIVLLLGKCAVSSVLHSNDNAPPDPKKTGIVVVKTNRPDTTVELLGVTASGKPTANTFHGNGAQPTMRGLPPGKYILTARSEGWPEIKQDITAEKGQTTEIAVHFKTGSLRLESDPAGATVRLGETDFGKTPLVIPQLPPGEHQLALTFPGLPPATFKATIAENVEATGSVRLPYGKLTVESTPPGATVVWAGRSYGQTPLFFDRFPAGTSKITLQSKDFPPLEIPITMEDRGDVKVSPELAAGFPELNPLALLRSIWAPEKPDEIAPRFDAETGPYVPRNGVVRNLDRHRLFVNWMNKKYRYSGIIKGYDRASGKVEFVEQKNDLAIHRMLVELSPTARNDPDLAAQLTKGATFSFYGRLSAVEESRWSMVITFEFSAAEPLH